MKPKKKLTPVTIRKRMKKLFEELREENERHINATKRNYVQRVMLQGRCPHEVVEWKYGTVYESGCYECDDCGATISRKEWDRTHASND